MNVECPQSALDEIQGAFKFSDAVLRHLVIKRDEAITEPSPLAKPEESKSEEVRSAAPLKDQSDTDADASAASKEGVEPASTESTDTESTDTEQADTESTDTESTDTESTDTEPTDTEQDAPESDAESKAATDADS